MSFAIGLSGLNAASANLKVIGDNIANSDTKGFKQTYLDIQNVVSNTRGSSANGVNGMASGADATHKRQDFSQGAITNTTNKLDVAIEGNGFFEVQNPVSKEIVYTRAGAFKEDSAGHLITSNGNQLVGYQATNGVITSTIAAPLVISYDTRLATPTTELTLKANFQANATAPATATFDPADSTSYNFKSPYVVYDSLGVKQSLNLYFVWTAANTWSAYATTEPATQTSTTGVTGTTTTLVPQSVGTLTFGEDGTLADGAGQFEGITVDALGGVATLDMTGSTQQGTELTYQVTSTQNGYTSGALINYSFDQYGNIIGNYTSGEPNVILGQLAIANFTAPTGLLDLGNNTWAATAASGDPIVGTAGAGGYGKLLGSALESSNADQQVLLVSLLAAQRTYQANAQVIQVENQIAQSTLAMVG
ncbi:MAG: flagellar hook protein FlgE [Alcaligenaceae bacterium]